MIQSLEQIKRVLKIKYESGFVLFFRNKLPGLFQDVFRTKIDFFQDSKIHINPLIHKISMLFLLTVCHTFHIFLLESNRFPALSRTNSLFPGLSSPGNPTIKFQDFPGFPGPVRTLKSVKSDGKQAEVKTCT